MRSIVGRVLLGLVASAGLAAAAGASGETLAGGSASVTVYAAASLTEVLPRIDPRPRYNFAGSEQLALQIRQGAPADVFAAASTKQPDQLHAEGLVLKPQVFATNVLVVIVPAGNPAHIRSVFDLRRKGTKLVIGEKGVPIGDYTRKVLSNLGLTSVLANVVSEETDVKHIVGKVALGEADAGFVYRTDAVPVKGKVRAIKIPARAQPRVRYELAIVKSTSNESAARAFVRRVLGKGGRLQLAAAGFGLPRNRR